MIIVGLNVRPCYLQLLHPGDPSEWSFLILQNGKLDQMDNGA